MKKKRYTPRWAATAALLVALGISHSDAKGSDANFASSGDAIGTLPVVAGGGGSSSLLGGVEMAHSTQNRKRAGFSLTLPSGSVSAVIASASGTGWIEETPVEVSSDSGPGQHPTPGEWVQLDFIGDIAITLSESGLRNNDVRVALGTDSLDNWLFRATAGGWEGPVTTVPAGDSYELDTNRLLDLVQWNQPLSLYTFVWPGLRNQIDMSRTSSLAGDLINIKQTAR